MKVTLTKIYKTNKDKEGNELKSKKGFPYTRMSIKTEEHGDKWVSGFENKDNKDWKEGDTVEVELKENGEYLNFETPKAEEVAYHQMTDILNSLATIKLKVNDLWDKEFAKKELTREDYEAEGDPYPDDIPF